MAKRIFDIIFSLCGLIIFLPIFLLVSIIVKLEDSGPVFFSQTRIGKSFKKFKIYKFRTMKTSPSQLNLAVTVSNDSRITKVGRFLRKTKIDELPQLFNILKGDMSFVGPRPDVPKYAEMFKEDFKEILTVRPGLTDFAAIEFINEEEMLKNYKDPEEGYIKDILPREIKLHKKYARERNFFLDIKLIFLTLIKLIKK